MRKSVVGTRHGMRRSCVLLLLCTGAAEAALLLPRASHVSHATPDRTLYERAGLPLPERAAPAWRAARPHAVRAGPRYCSAMRQEHAALLSPHATPARTLFERLHAPRLVPTSEAQAMPVVRLPGD